MMPALKPIAGVAVALLILNEIRGLIMAAPLLAAMYQTGGTWMQAWLLLCVALSVVVPVVIWRKCRGS
jgi:hypothetical protein